jgi:rhodanese-related sulfurtransferase
MGTTVSEMLTAAHKVVEHLDYEDAVAMIRDENAVLLDVRDGPEVEKSGLAAGAIHISRGMLEFRADAATPFHHKALDKGRPVLIYCASGGRAALAGKLLIEMGYERVFNLGGLKDWADAGGDVITPLEPGMS